MTLGSRLGVQLSTVSTASDACEREVGVLVGECDILVTVSVALFIQSWTSGVACMFGFHIIAALMCGHCTVMPSSSIKVHVLMLSGPLLLLTFYLLYSWFGSLRSSK